MVRSFGVGEIEQSVQSIGEPISHHRAVLRIGAETGDAQAIRPTKKTRVTTSGSRTAAIADSGTAIILPLSRPCRRT
jgi:hypothetical protein